MIKAVLRYTDCMDDKRRVNYYLSESNVIIIKTREPSGTIYHKVTILVESMTKLNEIMSLLNNKTLYGVTLVKVKEAIKIFGRYI